MTILQLKSLFYRYTGVFLAYKEENEYVDSKEYWKQFMKIVSNPENDMSPRNVHGLMIGMWQCDHGFTRPASFLRYRRPRFFFRVLCWFVDFYTVTKWDLESIYRKIFKPKKKK